MNNELLTTQELTTKLKVTKQTITRWIKEGCPSVTKKPYRFDLKQVLEWMNNRG